MVRKVVPLTLLKINSQTQLAVVEMGASHPSDIKELVDIALPNYGLITNVGKAHLLGFGSFEHFHVSNNLKTCL